MLYIYAYKPKPIWLELVRHRIGYFYKIRTQLYVKIFKQ